MMTFCTAVQVGGVTIAWATVFNMIFRARTGGGLLWPIRERELSVIM